MQDESHAGAPRGARSGRAAVGLGAVLALLALAPSWGSLGAPWIAEDAAILGRVHREGAAGDWTGTQYGMGLVRFWRPVVTTSWALQEGWTGVDVVPLRLANLAAHLGCALLGAGIVARLGGRRPAWFLAGALIALFPHQGGTVTWIAGRVDSLTGFLLLLAAWTALGPRPLLAAVPAFLACASKEVAFVLPVWGVALAWARSPEPREIARRAAPVVAATLVALVWRRLALGTWVGGYPVGGPGVAGVVPGALALGRAAAPLLALALVLVVGGGLGGALAPRAALAGLACAASGVLPLLPMLASGLEPQNERWLFVGETGLAFVCAAGLARLPRRPLSRFAPGFARGLAAGLAAAGLLVVAWRGTEAWRDVREWAAAGREAERRAEHARGLVAHAEPSSRPVLVAGFPRSFGGAYCLGFGAADRFRAPFPETPRPVWPLRPLFGFAAEARVRTPARTPREDGSLWPWSDPRRIPRLGVTDLEGREVVSLPLDERALDAPDDRSPALAIHGRFPAATIELIAYTELGYEPAPWGPAGEGASRTLSLMQALRCTNGLATIAQTLLQAADVGATRAYLEIRVVGASGEALATSEWIEVAWERELLERVW